MPDKDWALFGSGPLLVRRWIDEVGDLDVISRGDTWRWVAENGDPIELADGVTIYAFGKVTIGDSWAYGDLSIDELIDTAETVDGFPCVQLKHVVAYKKLANRPKDRDHLAIIADRTT